MVITEDGATVPADSAFDVRWLGADGDTSRIDEPKKLGDADSKEKPEFEGIEAVIAVREIAGLMLEPIDSETRLCTLGLDREARLTISVMAEFPPEGAVLVTMPLVTTDVLTVPKDRNVRLLEPAEAVPSEESNDSGMEVPKELAVTKLITFSEELGRVANELASETLRLAAFGERAEDCIRLLGTDTARTIELGNSVLEISAGDEEM